MARRVSPAHAQFPRQAKIDAGILRVESVHSLQHHGEKLGQGAETAGTAAHLEPHLGLNLCEQGIAPNDLPPAAAGQRRYLPARRGYGSIRAR